MTKLRMTAAVLLALLAGPLDSGYCADAEIRIIDGLGLTRAVRSVEGPATVQVSVAPKTSRLILVHADGLAPDQQPNSMLDSTFTFESVPEGTWKVAPSEPNVRIVEVKIVQ